MSAPDGRDVAIVGFDDTPTAAVMTPPLTTLRQPLEECARVAVRLLLDQRARSHSAATLHT
ncbi:substrate-binding domain-containing protein [Micromonospora yasonensis]|uniref:substrate-binding domain-containing protein n=1 Tax=Micromonospora yasonensis TaxID=1128667 RepID=UPI00222F7ADE|nr:substrate-binding domain-containing protein [Micromonospora yasonensis]MCW3839833.1 substrate-binding domain-containing protein [Micromonospora yasonensis]